ncbi:unnamed protein product [Amoebophrya sp. A120]|nr:unnamed protein product [Amoebophrya sp. A120]|eukprot:GSA120T00014504001.1
MLQLFWTPRTTTAVVVYFYLASFPLLVSGLSLGAGSSSSSSSSPGMNNVYDVALAPSTSTGRSSASAGSAAATTYTGALHQQPEQIGFLHRGGPGHLLPPVGPLPQGLQRREGINPDPRPTLRTPSPPVGRRAGPPASPPPGPAQLGGIRRSRSPVPNSPPAAPQRERRTTRGLLGFEDFARINVGEHQAQAAAPPAAGVGALPFRAYQDLPRSPSPDLHRPAQNALRNFENAQRQAGSPPRQVTPPPRERRDLAVPDAPRRIRGRAGQRRVGNFGPDIIRELQPEFEDAAERMRHDDDGAGALFLQGPHEVVRRAGLFDDSDGSDQENRPPR